MMFDPTLFLRICFSLLTGMALLLYGVRSLLIHGGRETTVNPQELERLVAAAPDSTEHWQVSGAEHCRAYFADRQVYRTRVLTFFERALRPVPNPMPISQKERQQTRSRRTVLPTESRALMEEQDAPEQEIPAAHRKRTMFHAFAMFTGYPRAYWYLLFGTLINGTATFVLPFESLYLVSVRHLLVSQASAIVALYGIGSCVSALLGGVLADRIGRRPTILSGLVGLTATTFGLAFMQETWLIALLTFLMGFWISWYRPASNAVLADLIPQARQAQANSLVYWAYNLGMAASPLLVSIIVPYIGYTILFCADGIGTALFCLLIFLGLPETRPTATRSSMHSVPQPKQAASTSGIWRNSRFLLYTGLSFFLTSIYFQYSSTLPADMQLHGLDAAQYGLVISINGIVVVLLGLPLSHLLTRFAPFKALAVSVLLLGAGFGLTALADSLFSLPLYAGSVLVWTIGEIIFVPVSATIVALLSPTTERGLYQGVARMSWGLSAFAGPLLGGLVLQQWGFALWIGCAVLGTGLAWSFLLLGRVKNRAQLNEEALFPSANALASKLVPSPEMEVYLAKCGKSVLTDGKRKATVSER